MFPIIYSVIFLCSDKQIGSIFPFAFVYRGKRRKRQAAINRRRVSKANPTHKGSPTFHGPVIILAYPVTLVFHGTRPPDEPARACQTPSMRFQIRRIATFSTVMTHLQQRGLWAARLAADGFFCPEDGVERRFTRFCCAVSHPDDHDRGCLRQQYNETFSERSEEGRVPELDFREMVDDGIVVLRGTAALDRRLRQYGAQELSFHELVNTRNFHLRNPSEGGMQSQRQRFALLALIRNGQIHLRGPIPTARGATQQVQDVFDNIMRSGRVHLRGLRGVDLYCVQRAAAPAANQDIALHTYRGQRRDEGVEGRREIAMYASQEQHRNEVLDISLHPDAPALRPAGQNSGSFIDEQPGHSQPLQEAVPDTCLGVEISLRSSTSSGSVLVLPGDQVTASADIVPRVGWKPTVCVSVLSS